MHYQYTCPHPMDRAEFVLSAIAVFPNNHLMQQYDMCPHPTDKVPAGSYC